jgi:hypothetical protein
MVSQLQHGGIHGPRRSKSSKFGSKFYSWCPLTWFMVLLACNLIFIIQSWQNQGGNRKVSSDVQSSVKSDTLPSAKESKDMSVLSINNNHCEFRFYPDRRYYGLSNSEKPDFLLHTEYIFGEPPTLLSDIRNSKHKLCSNQTEWLDQDDEGRMPFADGTNPSILHIDRVRAVKEYDDWKGLGVVYLATLCMTNSQCQFKDTSEEIEKFKLSTKEKPNTLRTVLLLLNERFEVIRQSTIMFQRDALWGKRKLKPVMEGNKKFATQIRPLDDARLFVYQRKIWISFRDGPAFGYDKQVLNPLHFFKDRVSIRASETLSFCCGRNMALMTLSDHTLQALTWVDPVTVMDVHTVSNPNAQSRRLVGDISQPQKKSDIHGTNAFMVPFGEDELLGMAHFHRPSDRKENEYARFGHHYTHAFYTITTETPYRLNRISPEFVLPSYRHPDDAEVIQFVSGLEVHGDDVVIAWGINDCEGAAGKLDVTFVQDFLRNVPEGNEVADLMMAMKN